MKGKLIFLLLAPLFVFSQSLHEEVQGTFRAEVIRIVSEREETLPGTSVPTKIQIIEAKILNTEREGDMVTIENDRLPLKVGDKFFVNYLISINGDELYTVDEPDRRSILALFILVFIAVVIFFGGMQGARALLALGGSFLLIFYVLLPQLLGETSPLAVSGLVASIILTFAIFLTHGVNRKSIAALLGSIISIILTIGLATFAVTASRLTGFADDAALYLNLGTGGELDFAGLFLAAIIIGVLGVLDDVAITQAAAVEELMQANTNLSRRSIYQRAMKIGREHVGALINTLALAYTGAALPLLLLFYSADASPLTAVNREIFAAEIIRTIVGSIGIILAVPITTLLATWLIKTEKSKAPE